MSGDSLALRGLEISTLLRNLVTELEKVELGERTIWECYEAQWALVMASPASRRKEDVGCKTCAGMGQLTTGQCPACRGTGREPRMWPRSEDEDVPF